MFSSFCPLGSNLSGGGRGNLSNGENNLSLFPYSFCRRFPQRVWPSTQYTLCHKETLRCGSPLLNYFSMVVFLVCFWQCKLLTNVNLPAFFKQQSLGQKMKSSWTKVTSATHSQDSCLCLSSKHCLDYCLLFLFITCWIQSYWNHIWKNSIVIYFNKDIQNYKWFFPPWMMKEGKKCLLNFVSYVRYL